MKRLSIGVFVLFVSAFVLAQTAGAQTTEFTYQGQLQASALPASGNFDFEFLLFDAAAGGSQIGATIPRSGVAVAAGIFAVNLDFGSSFPGAGRFLEIRVKQAGGGAFTTLSPRQAITSSPYSVKSLNSDTATNAVNATNATAATNFTGTLAGDVTGTQSATTVARLQTRSVANTAPLDGQVLKFNAANNRWQPDADNTGTGGGGGTITGVTPGTGLSGGGATGNVTLNIANGGVGTAQLADGAVTDAKIATVSGAKVTGAVTNASQLGGVAAAQYVVTTDPRMTDSRTPNAGSPNYIQNTTSPQASSNFNISGTGSADTLNAATQYNIGSIRVLSILGSNNLFAGVSAGIANTTGISNSFFGRNAGASNAVGGNNSFYGTAAGIANTGGGFNSFFGSSAGGLNTESFNSFVGAAAGAQNTSGTHNSFFGFQTGDINQSGSSNTLIGDRANVGASNLNFGTAIGAGASVDTSNTVVLGRNLDAVKVPGNLEVTGTLTANINGASLTNLNASNITTGTLNNARLGVVPIANGGTGSATQNFVDLTTTQTIAGDKTFSNTLSGSIVNSATQFNIGGNSVFSVAGIDNVFAGVGAGSANSNGFGNSFFGRDAGHANTVGGDNSFFGIKAGLANTGGFQNSFFGFEAGSTNSTGSNNSFFGRGAGRFNLVGSGNSFFGLSAGSGNTNGTANAFFGENAGNSNTTGFSNTMIGTDTDVSVGSLSFATALGAGSVVSASNTVVLGRAADTVQVPGNLNVAGTFTGSINGSGITNLNASNITTGTLAIARGGTGSATQNFVDLTTAQTIAGDKAFSNNVGIGTNAPTNFLTIGSPEATVVAGRVGIFSPTGTNLIIREITNDVEGIMGVNSGSGVIYGSMTNHNVNIRTNNTNRIVIDNGGNVGIGTATPADLLDVDGDIRIGTSGTNGCIRRNDGTGILGTCSSDLRFKQNITPFPNLLDQLTKLRPSHFFWRAAEFPHKHFGTEQAYGLIAQEVEQVMPELVTQDEQGYKQVDYSKLPLLTIQAVKEQQIQIEAQQKLIDQQKAEIEALNGRILAIEKALAKRP